MEPRYMKIKEKTSLYGRVFDLPIGHFTLFWPSLYGNPFQNLAIWKGLRSPDWAFYIVLALAIWKSIPKPRYMEGSSISRLGILHCFGPKLYGNPFQNLAIWNKFSIPE